MKQAYRNRSLLCTRQPHRHGGFTLIELMVAVAIVGILGAIALPSYQEYVKKGRRVDAKNAVLDMAAREERFFATQNKYTMVPADLGYQGAFPVAVPSGSQSFYKLDVIADATSFSATATPTGTQVSDKCYAYGINHLGAQSNTASDGGANATPDCW